MPYCGPDQDSCVEKQRKRENNCRVSCTGLYADLASDALRKDGDEQLKEQLKDLAEGKIPVLHGIIS